MSIEADIERIPDEQYFDFIRYVAFKIAARRLSKRSSPNDRSLLVFTPESAPEVDRFIMKCVDIWNKSHYLFPMSYSIVRKTLLMWWADDVEIVKREERLILN